MTVIVRRGWKRAALWIASIVVGVFFVVAGSMKFTDPTMVQIFADQGYADWFRVVIGVAEIGGGLLLLVPPAAIYGAAGLAIIMLRARSVLIFGVVNPRKSHRARHTPSLARHRRLCTLPWSELPKNQANAARIE